MQHEPSRTQAASPHAARWPLAAIAALSLALGAGAGLLTWHQARERLDARLADRAGVAAHGLGAEVARMAHMPHLLADDPRLQAVIARPDAAGATDHANRLLHRAHELAAIDAAYLIDAEGLTIAASNADRADGFMGHDYGFRHYFRQALRDGQAMEYAVGQTTGQPGLFLSARIQIPGTRPGVVVIKVALDALETAWARAGERIIVSDADGVVFLASRPGWRFRPIAPLSPESLQRVTATRRYPEAAIMQPLPPDPTLRGASHDVPGTPWTLQVTDSPEEARLLSGMAALATAALSGLALSALLLHRQRRQILQLRLARTDELEARVAARTEELAREIERHVRTHRELRLTHDQLLHADRLATLGRMATAIVHEIGQALSAQDHNLAAARLHLDAGRPDRAGQALERARAMLRRLEEIVTRLRGFGRRQQPVELRPQPLAPSLADAIEITAPRLRELGCRLIPCDPGDRQILGDGPRLVQVLTNLILNAATAAAEMPDPQVTLACTRDGSGLRLTITDSGPGMPSGAPSRLTEPFATTRAEGLGLGLWIVQSLLVQLQGQLHFTPGPDGRGTTVTLILPEPPA